MTERPHGPSLESALRALGAVRGDLARREDAEPGAVRCLACAHRCLLRPGRAGICKVRFHADGGLLVPWGYTAGGLTPDPIEKKPFFHVRPGSVALSFGMLGCDMHCSYCQNWYSSQALRDPYAGVPVSPAQPAAIAAAARQSGAAAVVSTYNEPLITAEWAAAVFDEARAAGLLTGFVSNGNATPEVLDFLQPRLDLLKVDLKGFDDRAYRRLGAVLAHVCAAIEGAVARGLWVEVVTLLVPGFNDDPGQLAALARFLAGISPDLPWHVTAFRPTYRLQDRGATTPGDLARAVAIGREAGLRFVYAGNIPGLADESTRCPGCGATLVERRGFAVRRVELDSAGRCQGCARAVPGIWERGRVPVAPP
ncbi:MAG: AmmeMemoRadiSam system radical SAM enzyme [Acidobacteria bacterium]|jgi:pyruvate formate lyase activating enzyme|nr:AmmeMemoRadiSam system radical SAM enzyme [Acidobacteriota bacterium]